MKKILYSWLVLWFGILLISSCAPGLYQYHQVAPEATHGHYREIPIYVDARMNQYGKDNLAEALNEENFMLNHSLEFSVKSWSIDINNENSKTTLETIKETHDGLMILWLNHDDPIVQEFKVDSNVMAFVNGIGRDAYFLIVLKDRISNYNLKIILLHELSHSLGARHVNTKSLMFPYYSDNQIPCIDRITAAQIATANGLDIKNLNYCSTNEVK